MSHVKKTLVTGVGSTGGSTRASLLTAALAGLAAGAGLYCNPLQALGNALRSDSPRRITKEDLDAKQAAEEKRLRKNAKRLEQLRKDQK
jgi:hypothetical protein